VATLELLLQTHQIQKLRQITVQQILPVRYNVQGKRSLMDKLLLRREILLHTVAHKIDYKQQSLQQSLRRHVSNFSSQQRIW
jgi:hypothetical protein